LLRPSLVVVSLRRSNQLRETSPAVGSSQATPEAVSQQQAVGVLPHQEAVTRHRPVEATQTHNQETAHLTLPQLRLNLVPLGHALALLPAQSTLA
jgi:hypothetical protein